MADDEMLKLSNFGPRLSPLLSGNSDPIPSRYGTCWTSHALRPTPSRVMTAVDDAGRPLGLRTNKQTANPVVR